MSRNACTRVACLRLPWFQIDVLQRAGHVTPGVPVAITQGEGSHARLTHIDPAGRAQGLTPGMRPSRAMTLVSSLQLIPWNAGHDLLLGEASEAVDQALEPLSPRHSMVAPGRWWLEPSAQRRRSAQSIKAMERAFAERVIAAVHALGFFGAKLGIADGPIAATAATRSGGCAITWSPPGHDARYLARLPVEALPLSTQTLRRLQELGLDSVRALQEMPPSALEARFGPEGLRAWRFAQGHDPRRPLTPAPKVDQCITLTLLEGCEELEPLLFVLRPALEQLVDTQAQRGHAIAHLSLTLERAFGPEQTLTITPSRALSNAPLLLELLRLRLFEGPPAPPKGGPVVALRLEASRVAPQRPQQSDLFQHAARTTADAEGVLVRLTSRLGKEGVHVAQRVDEQRPEEAGRWRPITRPTSRDAASQPPAHPTAIGACLRVLPSPRLLASSGPRPDRVTFAGRSHHLLAWHGPERLSGQWWRAPYDRDYYWVTTRQGHALWLFRARDDGRWFLHGWLD